MKNLSRKDAMLKLIMDLGGEGTRQEISKKIHEYWELTDEDKTIEPIPQKPYYWHRGDSCRQVLKDKDGFLDFAGGVWKITPKGIDYLKQQGFYEEKEIKSRLSKEEGKHRQIAVMRLLYENQDKICNKAFINNLFPEYYPLADSEYENDAEGYPKYWKTVAGVLSYLKIQNKANNIKHGVWQLTKEGIKELKPPLAEKTFYEPFKKWMSENLQCNAEICANNRRKGYYTNPDLVGHKDDVKITIEIKSSENINDCLKGLVQALCYRSFSNQAYLVVPRGTEDFERLSKLAESLGIGLVVFDNTSSTNPNFKIIFEAKRENIKDKDFE